jgi:hypothetical protein
VDGPAISLATNDFSARGGDQYPFRGAPFTTVGVTYQQALSGYLTDDLAGLVTAARYPKAAPGASPLPDVARTPFTRTTGTTHGPLRPAAPRVIGQISTAAPSLTRPVAR